jgi:hypothetical protein
MLTPLASVRSFLTRLSLRAHDAGQASAEYALVLLAAAGVAVAVTAWAKDAHVIGRLLDTVFEHLVGRVK